MPHVRITVGDLKCIRQADRYGKDDVYWLSNLRQGPAVDDVHTRLGKLIFDNDYDTSLPEMVEVGAGETARFAKKVVYDQDCPTGSYVFGTLHFMERDTALSSYFATLMDSLGFVAGGLIIGGLTGLAVGFALAGVQGAIGGGFIVVAGIVLIGFLIGAIFELMRPGDEDAHIGGMRIAVGPIQPPPPDKDGEVWALTMIPSGKLEVVDVHGAELIVYKSSHIAGPAGAGHRYQSEVQLEVTGGHR
jgi:hypothetical protein